MNAYRHIYENLQENIPVPAGFRNKRTEVIFIDLGEQVANQADERKKEKTERFLASVCGSLSADFPSRIDRSDLGEDLPRLDFD